MADTWSLPILRVGYIADMLNCTPVLYDLSARDPDKLSADRFRCNLEQHSVEYAYVARFAKRVQMLET